MLTSTPDYSSFNHIWFLKNTLSLTSTITIVRYWLIIATGSSCEGSSIGFYFCFLFLFFPFLSNHYGCLQTDSLTLWAVIVSKCKIWMVRCKSEGITKLKPYSVGNHKNVLSVTKRGHSKDQPLLFKCIATYI